MTICSDPCLFISTEPSQTTCYFCAAPITESTIVAGPSLPTIVLARLPCSFRRGGRSRIKDRLRKDMFKHDVVFYINLTRVDKLNSSVRKKP